MKETNADELFLNRLEVSRRVAIFVAVSAFVASVACNGLYYLEPGKAILNRLAPQDYPKVLARVLARHSFESGGFPSGMRVVSPKEAACDNPVPVNLGTFSFSTAGGQSAFNEYLLSSDGRQMCTYVYAPKNNDIAKDQKYFSRIRSGNYDYLFGKIADGAVMTRVSAIRTDLSRIDFKGPERRLDLAAVLYGARGASSSKRASELDLDFEEGLNSFISDLDAETAGRNDSLRRNILLAADIANLFIPVALYLFVTAYRRYLEYFSGEQPCMRLRRFLFCRKVGRVQATMREFEALRAQFRRQLAISIREAGAARRKLIQSADCALRSLIPYFSEGSPERLTVEEALAPDVEPEEKRRIYDELLARVSSPDEQTLRRAARVGKLCELAARLRNMTPEESLPCAERVIEAAMAAPDADYFKARNMLVSAIDERRRLNREVVARPLSNRPRTA